MLPVVKTILLILALARHGAEMSDPIFYTLRFPAPETHYVEVEARVPTGGRPALELMMPVWTPGSYVVREYARNVEDLRASGDPTPGGEPLAVRKTAKNRWRVETGGRPRITVRYRVYSREISVRTNFVDASFALLNGAATFLSPLPETKEGRRPYDVEVVPPPGWKTVVTPLPAAPGAGPHTFRAADFDTLVDSPLYAGNPDLQELTVEGRPHLLLTEGGEGVWDGARMAADLERLVREEVAFWGLAPYPRYVFFNLLTEEGGGLEHKDSTVIMSSRYRPRTREGRIDWLGLAGHEFFHAWNVKRLRPVELGPFDYEHEVYTESLWVAEGLTSYYDDLLIARAGLMRRDEYLKRLSKQIDGLETSPGRLVQPLGAASFDAWIKYYRKDENFVNSGVSYYTKGAVVGFLLDAEIRRATQGMRSLDDALRLAYRRYSGERGYTPEELKRVFNEVAGTDLGPFLARAVGSTDDLDYGRALDWFGLRFTDYRDEGEKENGEKEGEAAAKEPSGYLGVETELDHGRLLVSVVRRGTPAARAGVSAGDEILALDDYRVPPEGWKERLKAYRPGTAANLLVARRERLLRLPVTFGEKPPRKWKLEVDPKATAEQKAHLADWLRSGLATPEPVPAGAPGIVRERQPT